MGVWERRGAPSGAKGRLEEPRKAREERAEESGERNRGSGGAVLAAPPSVTVQPHGELPPLPIVFHLDGAALLQEAERRRVSHGRAGPRGCAVRECGAAGHREEKAAGGAGPGRAVAAAPGAATGARPQEASCAPRARVAANGCAAVLF